MQEPSETLDLLYSVVWFSHRWNCSQAIVLLKMLFFSRSCSAEQQQFKGCQLEILTQCGLHYLTAVSYPPGRWPSSSSSSCPLQQLGRRESFTDNFWQAVDKLHSRSPSASPALDFASYTDTLQLLKSQCMPRKRSCLCRIIFIISRLVPTRCSNSWFLILSVHDIFSILLKNTSLLPPVCSPYFCLWSMLHNLTLMLTTRMTWWMVS